MVQGITKAAFFTVDQSRTIAVMKTKLIQELIHEEFKN
jgi:hypothetical protein